MAQSPRLKPFLIIAVGVVALVVVAAAFRSQTTGAPVEEVSEPSASQSAGSAQQTAAVTAAETGDAEAPAVTPTAAKSVAD